MEQGLLNECTTPTPRGSQWLETHSNHRCLCKRTTCRVVLLGDSTISNLSKSEMWPKFEKLNCLNLGIGGDKIENVLYRIKNGALDEGNFQIVVLLAGTNNNGVDAGVMFQGILECVNCIHEAVPDVDVILPTLLPRGKYDNAKRRILKQVSELIRKLRDEEFAMLKVMKPERVHVVEIDKDVVRNGRISQNLMYDFVHLTDAGYFLCFSPILDKIVELLS
ncbi:platelet-activating factor acetylhydrolase IB subunit beta homolog [Ctenocephalides felis]|uniref:platelet-activating factor acetylhydrolase IB subunit beta homolog n=1 Tax=Ctenocephalides felis TaxID=7515 RepID=UPI000E6E133B|nr:platelet-activating factor acetylhydrolase IB subunit beta homolog [Ctenocephalides felis]